MAEEGLMESLMKLHGDEMEAFATPPQNEPRVVASAPARAKQGPPRAKKRVGKATA